MRPQIVNILVSLLCFCASTPLFAAIQKGSKQPPEPTSQRTPGPELPIDSNLYLLIAAALILGIYIAYKRHKAAANQDAA